MSLLKNKKKLDEVVEQLSHALDRYHGLFRLALKAEAWEEVLAGALDASGIQNTWEPNFNHKQGEDMRVVGTNERISCKSGQFVGKKGIDLKFSGSRMTRYPTIVEKVASFKDKKEDIYMLLARSKKEWKSHEPRYHFIAFPSDFLNYAELDWNNTAAGHRAISADLKCSINFKMSHQLWTTIKDFKNQKDFYIKEVVVNMEEKYNE